MSLDYESLPREYPHRFLPQKVDLADWNQAEGYFTELQQRAIGSVEDLQSWLDDYSELFIAMSEAASIRYVRMTEQTDRKEYNDAYLAFVENVEPKVKVAQFNLNRKFAASDHRRLLPPDGYGLLERKIENSVKVFREANVELEKGERKLAQQHQRITGSMTVYHDGRERTIPEMSKYLELQDRAAREESWRLTQGRVARDGDQLDGIFDGMVTLRDRIARNAGFENFRDYSFVSRERFDYGPDDCFRFHDAVEKQIVPLVREVYRERQKELGLDSLRPWDLAVDPHGEAPLRPFKTTSELVHGCEQVFEKVHPNFSEDFRRMMKSEPVGPGEPYSGKPPAGTTRSFST